MEEDARNKPYYGNLQYWRNQIPPKEGNKFEDLLFPPNENSLLGKDEKGNFTNPERAKLNSDELNKIRERKYIWKRASDIYKDKEYFIFEDKIEIDDLQQGQLGDCYFIASLAAMTEYPNMIYQLFKTKEINKEDYFEVIVFIDGKFQIVLVDDYFPVDPKNGELAFSKPHNHELWACILEKVWAKINGGYLNIIGGFMHDVLECFTGFPSQTILSEKITSSELYFKLKEANSKDCILTCFTKKGAEKGLIDIHAYTIIDTPLIKSSEKNVKLIKLRNTWGHKEWKGDWSDGSLLWGPEEKAQVEWSNKDEGIFYMDAYDYHRYFLSSEICFVLYNSYSRIFTINGPNLMHGNVFNIYLEEDAEISISLIKKSKKYHPLLDYGQHPTFLCIVKFDPQCNDMNKVFTEYDGKTETKENCSLTKSLSKGFYLVYAFHDIANIEIDSYVVKIDCTKKFKCLKMPVDERLRGYPLLREIIIQSVKENKKGEEKEEEGKKKSATISYENHVKNGDGLGHRICYNDNEKLLLYKVTTNKLLRYSLLFPYKEQEFTWAIPPGQYGCLFGLKNSNEGSINFCLLCEASYTCIKPDDVIEDPYLEYELYINEKVKEIDSNNDSNYDFISMSLKSAKKDLRFQKLQVNDSEWILNNVLKKEFPKIMEKLLSLPKGNNENEEIIWVKNDNSETVYVGQIHKTTSKREGRGAFIFKNIGEVQLGFYKNGKLNGKGYIYKNTKLTKMKYEGEFKEGKYSGYGILYIDNQKYEGYFEDGKKNGKGIYYFGTGSKWEGNFTDDKMNGVGVYTNSKGKKEKMEYNMDKQVKK